MKTLKLIFTVLVGLTIFNSSSYAQSVDGTEIGIDGYFGASTNGGSFTLGAKYGLNFGEYIITGPSIRYQRTWNHNTVTGTKGGFNVYGGGVFAHARFFNALFVGAEFEMMRTPFIGITGTGNWVPTFFLGGGYSQEFNEKFRINAGVMYDVINKSNSPFRNSYSLQNSQGKLIPLIYRIAFFFPIS